MGTSAVVFGHWYHTKLGRWQCCRDGAYLSESLCSTGRVDSFRNDICQFEGMDDVGIGHFVATKSVRWLNESPVVDVLSTYNIANMVYTKVKLKR